jgi:hypothetical protein
VKTLTFIYAFVKDATTAGVSGLMGSSIPIIAIKAIFSVINDNLSNYS